MNTQSPRVMTLVLAGILALVLTVTVGGIWTVLLAVNLTTSPAIPWAVAVMALLLWLLWRYLAGAGWPQRSSEVRRRLLRANRLPGRVFAWAVLAGVLAIVALAGLWPVLFQLAHVPARSLPGLSKYPAASVALVLLMASLVSSLAEEAAFRGYFLGLLERRLSRPVAVLIAAVAIAPGHALTQGFVWPTLLFYLFVDLMLGALASLTGSILPAIVVHCLGLLVFFTLVWPGDMLQRLAGRGGADVWLWIHSAQAIVFAALAVLAFIRLARLASAMKAAPLAYTAAKPASEGCGDAIQIQHT
ncbi:MAG TPA: CPBP family intramembrane glutamic endopeptidase [Ktedonobacterales bacterium]